MKHNKTYPSSTRKIYFRTGSNEGWHEGFYLKDVNRFVRNVNRWKDTKERKWYDDADVVEWRAAK